MKYYHFRDPIHGMIKISEKEAQIIDDPAFQRLRNIRQLGTSYLVYHGAEHTRFGHSIGVMHLISQAMDSLWRGNWLKMEKDEYLRIRQIARLVGLLHDVGHGPFSHVGEDANLYPLIEDFNGEKQQGHEVYTRLLVKNHFGKKINQIFSSDNITKDDIIGFLAGWITDKKLYFVKDLISGQLDADKMDYLLRDSYYCGVQYGKYDLHRILDTLCICYPEGNPDNEWQLGIESDGVHAVEEFILARYWMFVQVYFHKTRRIYDYYLANFIKEILTHSNESHYPPQLKNYLTWNDCRVLQLVQDHKTSSKWAAHLYKRQHIKEAFVSLPFQEENEDEQKDELNKIAWVIEQVKNRFAGKIANGTIYIDQAKTASSKSLIDIPRYVEETQESEPVKLFAIPVLDKHLKATKPIQDYSVPVRQISDRRINILRIYADKSILKSVSKYCNKEFEREYDKYIFDIKQKRETSRLLQEEVNKADKAKTERKKIVK